MHNRQSNKQVFFSLEFVNILLQMEAKVFFSLEFVNILLQMEAKAVKNTSSLL